MPKHKQATPDVAAGPSPTQAEIEGLARKQGMRALLNLNVEGEPGQVLSPNVEATWAHTFYMQHERLSLDVHFLDAGYVTAFLVRLERIAKPVYVHSRQGRRAAALIGILLAEQQGLSGVEAVLAARSRGLDCGEELRPFVEAEVDRRRARSGAQAS